MKCSGLGLFMGQAWQSLSDGEEEAKNIQSDVGGTGMEGCGSRYVNSLVTLAGEHMGPPSPDSLHEPVFLSLQSSSLWKVCHMDFTKSFDAITPGLYSFSLLSLYWAHGTELVSYHQASFQSIVFIHA